MLTTEPIASVCMTVGVVSGLPSSLPPDTFEWGAPAVPRCRYSLNAYEPSRLGRCWHHTLFVEATSLRSQTIFGDCAARTRTGFPLGHDHARSLTVAVWAMFLALADGFPSPSTR